MPLTGEEGGGGEERGGERERENGICEERGKKRRRGTSCSAGELIEGTPSVFSSKIKQEMSATHSEGVRSVRRFSKMVSVAMSSLHVET